MVNTGEFYSTLQLRSNYMVQKAPSTPSCSYIDSLVLFGNCCASTCTRATPARAPMKQVYTASSYRINATKWINLVVKICTCFDLITDWYINQYIARANTIISRSGDVDVKSGSTREEVDGDDNASEEKGWQERRDWEQRGYKGSDGLNNIIH